MRHRGTLLLLLVSLLLAPFAHAVDPAKKLSLVYRNWLEADVPYIISTDERKEFLTLETDEQRDRFIEAFWESRNPVAHSEINSYKEEHYRRLAYVNSHFGIEKYQDGWRSDMGRIYITLGPPQQRAPYHFTANVRDLEVWFYQGSTPALPPYFYVLFYRKGAGEEYRIYSPRQDGPQELVSTGQHDNKAALKVLSNGPGSEVARTSLSLIPTEPVDLDDPQPSMVSDLMLATIRNLADNPLEKDRIALNRSRERVTSSIFNHQNAADVVTAMFRDEQGRDTVSFLLRNPTPNPKLIGRLSDKAVGYKMTLHTVVATTTGKPVFEQQEVLTGAVQPGQVEAASQKPFAAEGRLPLVPGSYEVEVTLTNNLNLEALRWRNQITVPERKPGTLGISDLLVYTAPSPVRDPRAELPFSLSRLRFTPRAAQSVTIHQGEKLPLVFQIWLPKTTGSGAPTKTVHLHYLYGTVSAASKPLGESDEDVETSNSDGEGNLVTGHTLDTADLLVGNYRLVVGVSGVEGVAPAYSTLTVHVVPPATPVDQWTAYGPIPPAQLASDDLKRGFASEAQGKLADAERWYSCSLSEDPTEPRALVRLAVVLAAQHESAKLAKLSDQPLLREAIDVKTVLLIAQALRDGGDAKQAVKMLNAQLTVQPPNVALYTTQAELLEATGNQRSAAELRDRASKVGH